MHDPVVRTEEVLRDAASGVTMPRSRECLYCYLDRMVEEFACDNTLRFAVTFRDQVAPRATALESRLRQGGGYCDCEVLMNVVVPHPGWRQMYRPPAFDSDCRCPDCLDALATEAAADDALSAQVVPLFGADSAPPMQPYVDPGDIIDVPPCRGVRRGSTQPCEVWVRRRRW